MVWDWHDGWRPAGAWGGWLTLFPRVLLIAALVVAIICLVRSLGGGAGAQPASGPAESARDIPKRRCAANVIEREEYLHKLKDI